MIQLGGNIELEGFEAIEPGKLVVVKKLVGNYARQISDSSKEFEKLSVSISRNNEGYTLTAMAVIAGNKKSEEAKDKRLFYGLDQVLGALLNSVKQ